jgi:glycosidase
VLKNQIRTAYKLEFHVSRQARNYYNFSDDFFTFDGNVVFANFNAARVFAQLMNDRKDLVLFPEQSARASQINAMGLIDEILHMVIEQYRREQNPEVMTQALAFLNEQIGQDEIDSALSRFVVDYPPTVVFRGAIDPDDYLAGESQRLDGTTVSNRQLALEELLMLWLANANPAYQPYLELFDDEYLEKTTAYLRIITGLQGFFSTQPTFGPGSQNLIDMLRSPALAAPTSLTEQLEFLRVRWGTVVGSFFFRVLGSMDFVKEEEKPVFGDGGGGGGPALVYEFAGQEVELEQFSPDLDWMPNVVLMAKNSFVWLDQLSKKYKQPITRLDEIPDAELDSLARAGVTGLWLIGLWDRSLASKTIKQLRGNPEAVASAYSLMYYDIAADLGGYEAYNQLRNRAWKRGIRMASDMVPNHMGIDSRWVIEHPDWFIQLDYPPFPSYTFNGPNLSWDNRVGIFLEDHYYNNTDAAVVFKRVDFWSGSEKYIYHGNDGTSMPWNDTAQLNYLIPQVREAVIQTILHVARLSPIIRFDAAMTLAKKHYQRLWFPEPGHGGDIASRAEFGLTKEQFDAAFPQEFWREVVDRVATEAPDTLLLAEAFWLMEGYFVRTLGMHRVYNSAFMNMLRDEKNQEYRLVIKNTLEFEPEILKRYVNFMNNPDERTAVDQFNKGDKYFGVLTLMATMPGLPMLGHGQIEGFTEKYGMEYRRAYYDEMPDETLVERHQRQVFPLLRRRNLFAEVENFLLYDFYTPEGYVNEDVYAYSNRVGEERSLVLFHNRFANTRGWIRISTPYPVKTGDGEQRTFVQKSLGEGLGLNNQPGFYSIFEDQINELEYIRKNQELFEQGLYTELEAYRYQVFMNFRQVEDDETGKYAQLAEYLAGRGVPDVDEALLEMSMQPVLIPFDEMVNAGWFRWLVDNRLQPQGPDVLAERSDSSATARPEPLGLEIESLDSILEESVQRTLTVYEAIKLLMEGEGQPEVPVENIRQELLIALSIPIYHQWSVGSPVLAEPLAYLQAGPRKRWTVNPEDYLTWGVLLAWIFNYQIGKAVDPHASPEQTRAWLDDWLLNKRITRTLNNLGLADAEARRGSDLVKLLTGYQAWYLGVVEQSTTAENLLRTWLKDASVQRFLQINRFQEVLWFNKEAFEDWCWWMFATALIQLATNSAAGVIDLAGITTEVLACYSMVQKLLAAEEGSGYQVERMLEASQG